MKFRILFVILIMKIFWMIDYYIILYIIMEHRINSEDIVKDLMEIINLPALKIILRYKADQILTPDDLKLHEYDEIYRKQNIKIPSTEGSLEKVAPFLLFRFWHNYGCVLSDHTLFLLFKSLFFHTIFKQQVDVRILPCEFESHEEQFYDQIFSKYPELPRLCIIFQKMRHFVEDHMTVEIPNLVLIFNIIANYLTLLINMIIIIDVNKVKNRMYIKVFPMFYELFMGVIRKLELYLNSDVFLPYIKIEYSKFNIGLQRNHFSVDAGEFHIGDYTLNDIKKILRDDPILQLNIGDVYGNYSEERLPETPLPERSSSSVEETMIEEIVESVEQIPTDQEKLLMMGFSETLVQKILEVYNLQESLEFLMSMSDEFIKNLETLVQMGFPILDSFKLLEVTNNNLEEALQKLF